MAKIESIEKLEEIIEDLREQINVLKAKLTAQEEAAKKKVSWAEEFFVREKNKK